MLRLKEILKLSNSEFNKILKKKSKQKSWETLVVSENLTWEQFTKLNYFLHDLTGAKPVLSVSRDYPFKENYTHVLGYVSEASEKDILNNESIKSCLFFGIIVMHILSLQLTKGILTTSSCIDERGVSLCNNGLSSSNGI